MSVTMPELTLVLNEPLEDRIIDFKHDSENMKDLEDFLNELCEKARIEAELRQSSKSKNKFVSIFSHGPALFSLNTNE